MSRHNKDARHVAVVFAIIIAVVVVLLAFIGIILVYADSPIIDHVRDALLDFWHWLEGLFTGVPDLTAPTLDISHNL